MLVLLLPGLLLLQLLMQPSGSRVQPEVRAAGEVVQAVVLLLQVLCYDLPLLLVAVLLHVRFVREMCWD
jgi:hypothetical protein